MKGYNGSSTVITLIASGFDLCLFYGIDDERLYVISFPIPQKNIKKEICAGTVVNYYHDGLVVLNYYYYVLSMY